MFVFFLRVKRNTVQFSRYLVCLTPSRSGLSIQVRLADRVNHNLEQSFPKDKSQPAQATAALELGSIQEVYRTVLGLNESHKET